MNVFHGNALDRNVEYEQNFLSLENTGNILDSHQISPKHKNFACLAFNGKYLISLECPDSVGLKERLKRKSVKKLTDLGYFPTTMNILDRCPSNPTGLCLNMLSDKVPGMCFNTTL